MMDLREPVRMMARSLTNGITNVQAEDVCDDGRRNGYRERSLLTSADEIRPRIPKPRAGTCFPEDLIERYLHVDRAMAAAVSEMFANGVRTREVARVARDGHRAYERQPGLAHLRVAGRDGRRPMRSRPLQRELALHLARCHLRQMPRRRPRLVVRPGDGQRRGSDGYRRPLGMGTVGTEPHAGRLEFLRVCRSAASRASPASPPTPMRGSGAPSRRRSRGRVAAMRGASRAQRSPKCPTRQKRAVVLSILYAIFTEEDCEPYQLACEQVSRICPATGELLEDAEADALA